MIINQQNAHIAVSQDFIEILSKILIKTQNDQNKNLFKVI